MWCFNLISWRQWTSSLNAHSFIHSFIHSFTHSLIHSFTHSLIHSFTHSLIHSFTHSLSHSLIHSFTHSLIHSLTHSFTCVQTNTCFLSWTEKGKEVRTPAGRYRTLWSVLLVSTLLGRETPVQNDWGCSSHLLGVKGSLVPLRMFRGSQRELLRCVSGYWAENLI